MMGPPVQTTKLYSLGSKSQRALQRPEAVGRTNSMSHVLTSSVTITHRIRLKKLYSSNRDDNLAVFDGENHWDSEGRNGFAQGDGRHVLQGSFMSQALGSVDIMADRITQIAMQFVPESTSYDIVKVSVVGGLLLVVLSFVKGIVSFVLTVGTIVFGAYVSVKVFGMEFNDYETHAKPRRRQPRKPLRGNGRGNMSSTASSGGRLLLRGLSTLISQSTDEDDGLIDVTFTTKKKK